MKKHIESLFLLAALAAGLACMPGRAAAQTFTKQSSLINNPYCPLPPGAVFFYTGYGSIAGYTNRIQVIGEERVNGIACMKCLDQKTGSGDLYGWYAQDSGGSVWLVYLSDSPDGTNQIPHLCFPATLSIGSVFSGIGGGEGGKEYTVTSLSGNASTPYRAFANCATGTLTNSSGYGEQWIYPSVGLVYLYSLSAFDNGGYQLTSLKGITPKPAPPGLGAPLVLQINGSGTVTPNLNGKLLAPGTKFTVKAVPTGNNLFSNWLGGATLPYAVLSTSPSYTFTMQSNLVLEVNFVPNPFVPEQGTFSGLFLDTNDLTEASSGFFTLALTASGAFTGKIMTSGSTYSLPTTTFDVGGQAEFRVPTKQSTLSFNLQMDASNPASQQITGTVSDGAWTAGLTADRATFNATRNEAVNYEGLYTLGIAGSQDAVGSPGGFGWATLSVSSAGLINMAGSLADGTAMSQSVSVSRDGRWPFYASYPAPPVGNGGTMFGWITFSNQPATALGGTLYWFRPAGRTPAVYQAGFTNLPVPVIGSAFNPTEKPLLALTSGQVTLDGGDLPFAITNQITLLPNGAITVAPGNTNKLALRINKSTGAISGSFANPSNPKLTININGVLLQDQTNAAGYFLGTTQSGAFLLENP